MEQNLNAASLCSLEAEQALLGAIFLNNASLDRVSGFLKAGHFYDPNHRRVFEVCASLISAGKIANETTIKPFLSDLHLPGTAVDKFLANLFAEATTITNAAVYGQLIRDYATRRQVSEMLRDAAKAAEQPRPDINISQQLETLRGTIEELSRLTPAGDTTHIPLRLDEWQARKLSAPDRLLGDVITTTSRILLNAPTGIGKTNFGVAVGTHIAAGYDFLHWKCHRPGTVLYVDGEMSRRLLAKRAADAVRRLGTMPSRFHLLSHEDIADFQPLNTPAGKAIIERVIETIGTVDLVIFDNVMSLTKGDMKEEDGWQQTLPLVRSLTADGVGQIWLHHTGHDTSRGYGTKTKEWIMDTVMLLTEVKRQDSDVSFVIDFSKARERCPENHHDFQKVTVALLNDQWLSTAAVQKRRTNVSPVGKKFLEALHETFTTATPQNVETWKAVTIEQWRCQCLTKGLLDPEKPDSARSLFSKHKNELIGANLVACHDGLVWPCRAVG